MSSIRCESRVAGVFLDSSIYVVAMNETATMASPPNTFTQSRIAIFPLIRQRRPHPTRTLSRSITAQLSVLGVITGFGSGGRVLAQRRRHRRNQRLHEEGVVGRIDVRAQAVGLQFIRHGRSDRRDRRARKPFAQTLFASSRTRHLDQAANLPQ